MTARPNVYEPRFDGDLERPGFAHRGATLGDQAGSERLGVSLYEVEPGQASCPYHWHAGNEEMLVVLRGSVAVRGPDGWREVGEGEVIAFERGERGAHQVLNPSARPARFLMFSEMRRPEVVVYPDSGKVGARERAPGLDGLRLNFLAEDAVDYWEGEEPPARP